MGRMEINNGALSLNIPEGFSVLTEQDYQKMGRLHSANEWAIRNEEKHLILEVTWKKTSVLSNFVKIEKTAEITEAGISKKIPGYHKDSDTNRTIAGEPACGFRYHYEVQKVNTTAEYIVLKHEKQYYSFSWLGRTEKFEEYQSLFRSILDSAEFAH